MVESLLNKIPETHRPIVEIDDKKFSQEEHDYDGLTWSKEEMNRLNSPKTWGETKELVPMGVGDADSVQIIDYGFEERDDAGWVERSRFGETIKT